MKEESRTLTFDGKNTRIDVQIFDERDHRRLRALYLLWAELNKGMKIFKFRGINLPEGISESAFCLCFGEEYGRALKVSGANGSFDVVNLKTGDRIQIKATSVERDLTSFGPDSVWDRLYFLDFFRRGENDGSFDVYEIPNDRIYSFMVNKSQTLKQQQKQGRRPRLSIKEEIIAEYKINPIRTCHL